MKKQSFGGFGSTVGGSLGSILGKRLGSIFGKKMANKYLPGLTWKLGGALFPGVPFSKLLPGLAFFKKKRKKRKKLFAFK